MRKFQLLVGSVAFVAVFGVGNFLYLTREIAAPSQAVQDSVQQLATSDDDSSASLYRVAQDNSQATYTINEVLNGADKTVVGTTDQVAGGYSPEPERSIAVRD